MLGDIKFVADSIFSGAPRTQGEKRSDESDFTMRPSGESSGADEGMTCDGKTVSEIGVDTTAAPELIICPIAFAKGTLGKNERANVPKVTCSTCYPRVSYKMETLGYVLLHEYTHWEMLMSPVMRPFNLLAATDVVGKDKKLAYGPWRVLRLREDDKIAARRNADSCAWLATEAYWAQHCVGRFGAFTDPEEEDN
jgi:hypothetical protein